MAGGGGGVVASDGAVRATNLPSCLSRREEEAAAHVRRLN